MPERDDTPQKKVGLHGWRAFLVVFASGTLAAFLVVGMVVGVVKSIFSLGSDVADSATNQGGGVAAGATGAPHTSLEPGKLNLCKTSIPSISRLNASRVDSRQGYVDSAQEDGYSSDDIRTVSDDCDWKLVPEYNSVYPWDFDFSYEATITSPGKETPVEIASHQFEDRAKGLESGVASVEDEGEGAFSEFTDRSYFVYGASGSDSDKTTYVLLAQVKSVVYEVRMDATSDDSTSSLVPKSAFESEVKKLASRMEVDLGIWVPE